MNMPEYMRVRQYLYNLINKSDGKELQIPSENDLCRLFNVSRITVRGAIQGLVKDKYLIPRRGIGTFMNPERIGKDVKNTPTVGIIVCDGRNVTNDSLDPALSDGIIQSGMNFEMLFLPDSDMPERLIELIKSGIDAVIWQSSNYAAGNAIYLEALKDAGIPLLVSELSPPLRVDIDNIVSSPEQRGTLMAEYLFSQGIHNMLFVHNYTELCLNPVIKEGTPHQAYCARMAELTRGDRPDTGIISLLELEMKLQKSPEFINRYQVIYSLSKIAPYVINILDRADATVPAQISYLLYGKSDPYIFHGLNPNYVDNETALRRAVIKWLELRIHRGCREGRFEEHLTMEIIPGETVKKRTPDRNADPTS